MQGVQEHQLPGWGTRRHLSRRLAAKPVWRKLQQSSTRLPEHTSAATAADSYSVHLSAPLTAAGLPARVFVIDFYKNRTRSNNSVQEAGIQHSTVPVVDSTIFTEEPSNRSASNHTTRSAPAANQWYNDQVSGVSYFGRIPGSNANQSLSGLYPLGADLPATNIPNGCPDFAYPLVVQYPTIFFTVALQDFGSSEDLGIDEEVGSCWWQLLRASCRVLHAAAVVPPIQHVAEYWMALCIGQLIGVSTWHNNSNAHSSLCMALQQKKRWMCNMHLAGGLLSSGERLPGPDPW